MGTVFLAERADGQFEKQVAIKILNRGADTAEILRRFRAERQILARLDHPNIARLLDAGTTEDGLPYFIMDYIVGAPVTRFAVAQKLSTRQRLELFLRSAPRLNLRIGIWLFIATSSRATFWRTPKGSRSCSISVSPSSWRKTKPRRN
jgi:serine/threonine protein kinase